MSTTMISKTIKALAMVAITMAMLLALSSITLRYQQSNEELTHDDIHHFDEDDDNSTMLLLPSKRINRFLGESNYDHHGRSLKPADHCHKDGELCNSVYGENFHCCGNKCFDFSIDKKHCGGCKNKCKFTYDCCNGKCVDKAYDKRHCGRCNKKCLKGQFCVYGMCDYA